MSVYHNTSSSSCTGCSVQKRGTFTHVTGSTSVFVAPICDCGQFVVLRIATTEKQNVGKIFRGCLNYKVKFIELGLIQT